ncbi:MAG: VanW family protein [Candidatus Daviesbacteria bacterium]|nr:VanW family protein [Candidatus Daviesbacteria bacterium]
MAKAKKKSHFRLVKQNLLPIILSILFLVLTAIAYQIIMADKYYPLTFVGSTNISFLTEGQAIRKLQSNFQQRLKQKLQLGSFTVDPATASANLDYSTLSSGFKDSHQGIVWERLSKQLQILFLSYRIHPKINLSLDKQLDNIASLIDRPPQDAQLIFDETPSPEGTPSAHIQIKEGVAGLALDKNAVEKIIADFLLTGQYNSELPLKTIPPTITTNQVARAKQALETVMKEPIKLTFDADTWVLDAKQLLTLLDLTKGENLLLDKDQAYVYLKKIAAVIDQNVQEGLFEFNPGTKRVTAFKPSQEGRRLNMDQAFELLTEAISGNSSKTITLPVDTVKPKIATSDVNSLGIKELLGRGVSNFAGSIANRIYNIGLTASRINGVLVPPGEVFSFNQTIGDISAATGFRQAYVIKEGRTVLDDGGGVCQDSTTLFRAVLNAGLPVVKRTAHAYRVGYYEQGFPPGLDATVFYPSVDFQFKNDTSAHILIQAYISGITLYVDLYGTPDGREVNLTRPVVTNQTPPPPDLRQDDPTLPKGTVKQVDWSAWGATVTFKRIVTRNGETIMNETWKSFFKPWQAIYLVGTKEN